MTDKAEKTAFNDAAPTDERVDALGILQKAYMPTESDLLPKGEIREVIQQIQDSFEESDMRKALTNRVVVPFPSKNMKAGKPGMSSLYLDDWQINIQGDYIDRPSALGFDSLRAMVEQTPVLNAVIFTRIRQVQRFARVAEQDTGLPGFEIRHVDRKHNTTGSEQENFNLLTRMFTHCGWEFNARRRKALRRDSFSTFMSKCTRDTLVMDSCGIETEWKKDMSLGIDGFYAVDGSTIRLCTEQGYRGQDEIFALQVVGGMVRTPYTFNDLIYEPRNPRTDVRAGGYGISETELLVRVVTGYLNAMTVNAKGFDSNSIPKGILHMSGNYDQKDIDAFKRYWSSMVKGVNNAWSMPIMVSKDQDSKASFENFGIEFNEMMFSKWMVFLSSTICAIYGMSPQEINSDSFSGGNTSQLSGSDTTEKLEHSKDSGLRPLLSYFENLFTDYIVSEFSQDYCFRFTGLDIEDQDKKWEAEKLILTTNELRAEKGYELHENELLGNAPLNPSLIGLYMMQNQPEEPTASQKLTKSLVSSSQPGSDWWD
jgi:hypothetical protein